MGSMSTDSHLNSSLQRKILAHFDDGHRDLPWRRDRSPYSVWVSEIMLQQTRVDTVVPYFNAWMERYPDVTALAEADEGDVLKSWEGLGYYSRARNLHRAARVVRESMKGQLPRTAEELRVLPGIGPYTSGAIASLAFGERVPAVDGNVRRVLSRTFDLESPDMAELTSLAADLVPAQRPGDWNEALMEFGATICLPRAPKCEACPVGDLCLARARGTVPLRPSPRKKSRVRDVVFAVTVPVRDDGCLFLVRRPSEGLLGGLWEFPQCEVGEVEATREVQAAEAASAVDLNSWGLECGTVLGALDDVFHVFTHLRATYRSSVVLASGGRESDGARWLSLRDLTAHVLPVAQRRILNVAMPMIEVGLSRTHS